MILAVRGFDDVALDTWGALVGQHGEGWHPMFWGEEMMVVTFPHG